MNRLILALIIFLFVLTELYNLRLIPGFFCDEASVGYNAFSILTSGHDEWGRAFPLFFKAFGEYKNPLDIYATVPFIFIFGLTEFSVRATSMVVGASCLIAIYILACSFIKNKRLVLIFPLLLAITPWFLHVSIINLEGILFVVLFSLLALLFFLRRNVLGFGLVCAIGTYSYFPARIIFPGLFVCGIAFFFCQKFRRSLLPAVFLFIMILLPLIVHMTSAEGMARFDQVSVFKGKSFAAGVQKVALSYILHFSPDFLFFKGDIDMPGQFITRHSIRGVGEFYIWELPLMLLGIFYLWKKNRPLLYIISCLLVLYPIPSSITTDIPPQATRAVTGIVPLVLLTGVGIIYLVSIMKARLHKNLVVGCIVAICLVSLGFHEKLMQKYPMYSADFWGWQYGPSQIMPYFIAHHTQYDNLYMAGSFNAPDIFLKFYDPRHLCQNCAVGGLDRFDSHKKQLFALRPGDYVPDFTHHLTIKKIIYYPNGQEAFYIGQITTQ